MARKIKESFLQEFLIGSLTPLLRYVQLDDTLNMELRGKEVTIYYRGGALLTIHEDSFNFDGLTEKYHKYFAFTKPDLLNIEEYIPKAKHLIDLYINTTRNHLGEKDIQQQIARDNNYSQNSLGTDFFIIDTEYQDLGRFDIVALKWDSTSPIRKLPENFKPTITIFEVKQGEKSITGESGMESHLKDFEDFCTTKDLFAFKSDMVEVFNQKRKLKLIKGMEKYKEVKEVALYIDFVFLLVNYKNKSTKLRTVLKNIKDCRFIYANPMGYGLYARHIISKQKFIERFL